MGTKPNLTLLFRAFQEEKGIAVNARVCFRKLLAPCNRKEIRSEEMEDW